MGRSPQAVPDMILPVFLDSDRQEVEWVALHFTHRFHQLALVVDAIVKMKRRRLNFEVRGRIVTPLDFRPGMHVVAFCRKWKCDHVRVIVEEFSLTWV